MRGRLRRVVVENQRVLRTISIPFDGKDDDSLVLPIGLYILVVESSNESFKPQKKGIVIAMKSR